MSKTSTLIYLYENLNNENEQSDQSVHFLFDEFSDVLNELDFNTLLTPEPLIEKVLGFAAKSKRQF